MDGGKSGQAVVDEQRTFNLCRITVKVSQFYSAGCERWNEFNIYMGYFVFSPSHYLLSKKIHKYT